MLLYIDSVITVRRGKVRHTAIIKAVYESCLSLAVHSPVAAAADIEPAQLIVAQLRRKRSGK